MEYKKCKLFGMKSKKKLLTLLFGEIKKEAKEQSFFVERISPFLLDDKRLIEAPKKDLKKVQKRILKSLQKLSFPEYVFSGIKRRSYIDNVRLHLGNNYVFKTDISKFFPSISRDVVYNFYLKKLDMSPDVSEIMTNLSTIDLNRIELTDNLIKSKKFLLDNKVKTENHLITGSPLSPILSYLVNQDMFDEIVNYCNNNSLVCSIYIDDIVFSSKNKITAINRRGICKILKSYNYIINKSKCHWYNKIEWKKITGVIVTAKGNIKPTRQLEKQTKDYLEEFRRKEYQHIDNLLGCVIALNMVDSRYQYLYKQINRVKKHLIKLTR